MINRIGNSDNHIYKEPEKRKDNLSFKGAQTSGFANSTITSGVRFMEKDARSYFVLSLLTMGIPRTVIDSCRNATAGIETAFYETYGIFVNYMTPGLVALGIAKGLQAAYNINKSPDKALNLKLWVNDRTADKLYKHWKAAGAEKTGSQAETYIRNILSEAEILKVSKWEKISEALGKTKSADEKSLLDYYSKKIGKLIERKDCEKTASKRLNIIINEMAGLIGAKDRVKFGEAGKSTLPKLTEDAYQLAKNYFTRGGSGGINIEKSLQKYKMTTAVKTVGALSLAVIATFSAQYINRWITYKRTGKKGFVGYSDFNAVSNQAPPIKQNQVKNNKDENNKNKAGKPSFTGMSDLMHLFTFRSAFPHPQQVKYLIFPACAVGSLSASRDDNEFKERLFKSSFAIANFFFIPILIEKLICYPFSKKDKNYKIKKQLFNYPEEKFGYFKARIKSHDEIISYCESKIIKSFRGTPTKTNIEDVKKNMHLLRDLQALKNKSKLMSYLYTFITVGAGIPIINAILTEKRHKKDLEKQQLTGNPVITSDIFKTLAADSKIKDTFSSFLK